MAGEFIQQACLEWARYPECGALGGESIEYDSEPPPEVDFDGGYVPMSCASDDYLYYCNTAEQRVYLPDALLGTAEGSGDGGASVPPLPIEDVWAIASAVMILFVIVYVVRLIRSVLS